MHIQEHLKLFIIILAMTFTAALTMAHDVPEQTPTDTTPITIALHDDLYQQTAKRAQLCALLNWADSGWKAVCKEADTNIRWWLYDVTQGQIKQELTAEKKTALKAIFNDNTKAQFVKMSLDEAMEEYDLMFVDAIPIEE